jgi:hypothetical protein
LIKRNDQGKYFWESRSCAYWQAFEQPKIAYPDIARKTEFTYDTNKHLVGDTMFFIPTEKLWLLGLLNSKTVFWLYTKISSQLRGGVVRYKSQYVSQIPIPAATPAQQAAIEVIVERILAVKQTNPAADVTALEAEIDQQVYRLYGLTAAEVRVVEGAP